ncbi:hypothetical protein QR680_014013 [Steinernema hermaphroditum]|uniref:Uncharacterized protein n=1 Tax=Steinernema hermaphroditum TaxID=289476 RepID=A0AA39I8U3_9BILA|nr:hypothetical protein QR680_014013 [Steinernema hermaphroditum]
MWSPPTLKSTLANKRSFTYQELLDLVLPEEAQLRKLHEDEEKQRLEREIAKKREMVRDLERRRNEQHEEMKQLLARMEGREGIAADMKTDTNELRTRITNLRDEARELREEAAYYRRSTEQLKK